MTLAVADWQTGTEGEEAKYSQAEAGPTLPLTSTS